MQAWLVVLPIFWLRRQPVRYNSVSVRFKYLVYMPAKSFADAPLASMLVQSHWACPID